MDRREFLKIGAAAAATVQLPALGEADHDKEWNAQWIWYPGQLAAYRHARRIRLAVQRCTNVGYPANFRQPRTEAWFRKRGRASEDTPLRWAAPVARVRTTVAGHGGDITLRRAVLRKASRT